MSIHSVLLAALAFVACADAPAPGVATESGGSMGTEASPGGVEAAAVAVRLRNDTGMTITRLDLHACIEPGAVPPPARDVLAGEPLAAGASRSVRLALGCHYARPTYDDGSPDGLEIGEKIQIEGSRTHGFRLG